jgi:hypothetical protein
MTEAIFAGLIVVVFGRLIVMRWLMRQHAAGLMSGRTAGWLFGATIAAPLILIVALVALRDIGSAALIALVLLPITAVSVIPWVAIFRYPDDSPESKRPWFSRED